MAEPVKLPPKDLCPRSGALDRELIARRLARRLVCQVDDPDVRKAAGVLYRLRAVCGAHARSTGQPCRMRVAVRPDGTLARRCRLHGGLSTGPRTVEGKARAFAAMIEGMVAWHARRRAERLQHPPSQTKPERR